MNALQSKWPGPHGAIYTMRSNAKQCLATHSTAEQCAATHSRAKHSNAKQRRAMQSNAILYPGRAPPQGGVLGRYYFFGPSLATTE